MRSKCEMRAVKCALVLRLDVATEAARLRMGRRCRAPSEERVVSISAALEYAILHKVPHKVQSKEPGKALLVRAYVSLMTPPLGPAVVIVVRMSGSLMRSRAVSGCVFPVLLQATLTSGRHPLNSGWRCLIR